MRKKLAQCTRTTDTDLMSRTFDFNFKMSNVYYKVFEMQTYKTADLLLI